MALTGEALYWVAGAIPALLLAPASGSFAGLLALRLPAGKPVGFDRSRCPHCDTTLDAVDLAPLVTWVATRGRCRHCGARVPAFYPLIELAALGVAAWAVWVLPQGAGVAALWATCVLGWLLLALAVADWRTQLLPDALTLPLAAAGFLWAAWQGRWTESLLGAAAGLAGFAAVRWAYRRWRGREGLGLGDVKLAMAAGAWIGWAALPSVVLLAAVAGLATALPARLRGRLAADAAIPFGTFLCLGLWLVWLYGPIT